MSIEDNLDASIATPEERAADWIVRQDGTVLDDAEQAAFAVWLAMPENRREYDRQHAVWQRYSRMASLPVPIDEAPNRPARRTSVWRRARPALRRRSAILSAVAASVALAMVGLVEDWPTRLRADYTTGIGERHSITLPDGSVAILAPSSALAFDRSGEARVARLLGGAAQFEVAPDPRHPFRVEAAAGSVTALGTVFSVREDGDGPEVAVLQHSVAIRTAGGKAAVVHEGETTRFTAQAVSRPIRTDVLAQTAWTRGKLIVFDQPLGEVVATIGRQRRGYWTVRGEAANLRVNGVYDLDHPLAALDALEKTLNLRSLRLSNRFIVITR
ncbi:FecR family protein [Novosphingobium sp.]|jgi:transmembrane sensor|uniref:FecR family protein n=1 Tax=Novosphingobium sp. TaxID=1874826 RepID=UPI002FE0DAD1